MPPPTKRQKQAKQQYASSSRCFDNGLIEDVFEVFLDPDYVPVSDAESFRSAADGTFLTAKRIVPELLDACPIKTICAFYRKSWRYMDAYRKGLNARQAEFAVKKYKSHRRCGPTLMMNLGVLVD
ncbi:hypothetical protein C8R48DRAFT_780576 [Suillus tomentosus]|nr:hypothetical protein C8R48DRAFT_780576 [Suillus tomentosus]